MTRLVSKWMSGWLGGYVCIVGKRVGSGWVGKWVVALKEMLSILTIILQVLIMLSSIDECNQNWMTFFIFHLHFQ